MDDAHDDHDDLDAALTAWAREIPALDKETEGIVERIHMLAYDLNQSMAETLAEFSLDRRTFRVLGRLRRVGPPYQRAAGALAGDLQLSSGAMTNRLDRMETAGLIRRLPDPNDRRGTLIEPTEAGHAAWDASVGKQARREQAVTAVLTEAEREELHRLLRRLMRAFPDGQAQRPRLRRRARGMTEATRATDAIDAAGIPYTRRPDGAAHSAEESAQLQGIELGALLRTIVVRRGDDDYVFVLVPGGRRFDWPKVRAQLGVKRLSLPDADEAREVTGYERGAITPFGATRAWPVIVDASVDRPAVVAIGGGSPRRQSPSRAGRPGRRAVGRGRRRDDAGDVAHGLTRTAACGTIGRMAKVPLPTPVLASPLIRRVAWHLRRVTGQLDRRFFLSLTEGIVVVVAIAALLITLLEKPLTIESLFNSFNWGVATVLGQGNGELRDLAGRAGGQLAAYPVRGRDARLDHRVHRRDGHRLPAQGGRRVWGQPGTRTTSSCAAGTAPPAT